MLLREEDGMGSADSVAAASPVEMCRGDATPSPAPGGRAFSLSETLPPSSREAMNDEEKAATQ